MHEVKFVPMSQEAIIEQGEHSQIRIQVFAKHGERLHAHMSITLWSRYLTRSDKDMGIEDRFNAPFRPTDKHMTFPVEDTEEVIEAMRDLKWEFLNNG